MPTIDKPMHQFGGPLPMRATSDLHLSEATAPYVFAALDELRKDARENKGVTLLLGDLFDQATTLHAPTFAEFRRMLQHWPDSLVVLAGNHDQWGLKPAENVVSLLEGRSCRVIDRPVWTRLGRFVPYTRPEDFRATLDGLTMKPVGDNYLLPIVWCHHGFRGAYRNAMSIDKEGVSSMDIPANHLVVTGHYHMPQTLGRIVYCGSPYETSFAEEGQAKGWLRWENAIENPIPTRVAFENTAAPRHITIHWDPTEGPPEPPKHARPGDIIRIKAHAQKRAVAANMQQLEKAGLTGVPVLAQPTKAVQFRLGDTPPRQQAEDWVLAHRGDDAALRFAEENGLWDS